MSKISTFICDFCLMNKSERDLDSCVQLSLEKNSKSVIIITPFLEDSLLHCCKDCKPLVIESNQK